MDQPYSFLADWLLPAGASPAPLSATPYSPFADWLSKFHTASEPIQALWIVALTATVLGVTWLVMRGLREIAARRPRQPVDGGPLIYGVFQDLQGRWMVYSHGRSAEEVDWTNPSGELVGRGRVVRVVEREG
jgi:hypothetical protein